MVKRNSDARAKRKMRWNEGERPVCATHPERPAIRGEWINKGRRVCIECYRKRTGTDDVRVWRSH